VLGRPWDRAAGKEVWLDKLVAASLWEYSIASVIWQGRRTAVNRRCWVGAESPPGLGAVSILSSSSPRLEGVCAGPSQGRHRDGGCEQEPLRSLGPSARRQPAISRYPALTPAVSIRPPRSSYSIEVLTAYYDQACPVCPTGKIGISCASQGRPQTPMPRRSCGPSAGQAGSVAYKDLSGPTGCDPGLYRTEPPEKRNKIRQTVWSNARCAVEGHGSDKRIHGRGPC